MMQIIREKGLLKCAVICCAVLLISGIFSWQIYAMETKEIIKQVIIVKNDIGQPIKDASFEIQNEKKEIIETCISDENGRAEIKKTKEGNYQLIQTKTQDGYELSQVRPIVIKIESPIKEEVVINKLCIEETGEVFKSEEDFANENEEISSAKSENSEPFINANSKEVITMDRTEELNTTTEPEDALTTELEVNVEIIQSTNNPTQLTISTVGYAGKTGIGSVYFPTWTERNGQDDLRWYQGIRTNNGEYSVTIDTKDHGFETGVYNVHTYIYGLRGEVIKTHTNTMNLATPNPKISVTDVINNTYKVQLTGASNPQGVTNVIFPTWSMVDGQDDLRWEAGTYVGNDTWEATINIGNYKQTYDTFITHTYVTDQTGTMRYIKPIEKVIEYLFKDEKVNITQSTNNPTQFTISTVGYAGKAGISSVYFPTWTERNGQDDLRWYQGIRTSNGEYSVTIDTKDHGFETGVYDVHTYIYGLRGEVMKIHTNTVNLITPNPAISVTDVTNNSYKVRLTGVCNPQGVTNVIFPTWSKVNGQDDLRWEVGTYVGNDTWEATINIGNYKQTYDTFITHTYVTDQTGTMRYIKSIEKVIEYPFKDEKVNITQSTNNPTQLTISTVGYAGKTGIGSVYFPTWTERNGQDDLRWYQGIRTSNGEYSVTIDTKDHGFETGVYNVHTYIYGLRGEVMKTHTNTMNLATPNPVISVTDVTNNSYKVRLTGVSNHQGVTGVVFPTWTKINGQDDLRWEVGTYVGNDTWEATIRINQYNQSYDTFVTHAYVINCDRQEKYIVATEKKVSNPFLVEPLEIEIKQFSEVSKFVIETKNTNGKPGVTGVAFGVWTKLNGQDEINWYVGTLGSNGEYSAVVDIANHGFETGTYIVHAYLHGNGNENIAISKNSYTMGQIASTIEYDNAVLNNVFKVRIKNVGNENGVSGVVFPTWSRSNGQDDLRWEQGTYIGNHTWEATINLRDYNIIVDDFITHAYLIDQYGKYVFAKESVKSIKQNTSTIYGFYDYPLDKNYKPNSSDPTDWFGPRWGSIHEGIDIPADRYASCYAVGNGIVEKASYFMGYGRYVRIRTTDRYGESVSFFYGHLQEINVSVGQYVNKGDRIGTVGGSGYDANGNYVDDAYGSHLHFGAIVNSDFVCVDPEIWIDFHNPYSNVR